MAGRGSTGANLGADGRSADVDMKAGEHIERRGETRGVAERINAGVIRSWLGDGKLLLADSEASGKYCGEVIERLPRP